MANEFKIKNGLIVSGSAEITNNLTVNGRLTAEEYHVSFVSSSVLYESGSTKFGDSSDDTHLFTGSIKISGSIDLNGQTLGTGKLDETTFESFTSSYLDVSSSLDERVGDLESFSSSLDNSFVSETEFGSHTSSINGRVNSLETESGSIRGDFNSFTSSYTDVSTSIDSRLDTLETLSGSFTGSFSGSFTGDGTNLYNIPASGVTGLNLTQIADGSVTASVSNTNGLRVNSKTEITGSLIVTDGITGSIDYSNITNKPTLVSGSEQVDITGTTGYSTFSSSISSSIGDLSSSVATTTNNLDGRLDNVETSTGSLNSFTSSINTTIKDKLDTEDVISGSVQVTIGDTTGFSTFSSSIDTTDSNQNTKLGLIETSTGSLNDFTSSASDRLSSIETSTSSLNTFSSSLLTRVSSIESTTSSLNTFTSSINGAVEVTGSNLTVKGDLLVKGTTTQIDSTTINIGDNIIQLNGTGATNAGLVVRDNTSPNTASGSLLWDTTNDEWIAGVLGSEERIILETEFTDLSSSVLSRVNSLETESGSVRGDFNSYTGSNDSTNTTQNGRLSSIEGVTGSIGLLNTYTGSNNTVIGTLQTTTGSLNTFTSSASTRLSSLETESGSIRTDLNTFTSSTNNRLTSIESTTSSLNTFTSSASTRLSSLETASGSIRSDFNTYTSSNDSTNTTQNGRLSAIETSTGSLNSYTSSNNTRIGIIETATGSLNTFTSSALTRLSSLETESGSVRGDLNTYTSSNDSTNTTQNGRLTSLEGKSGSYATTGSNIFVGSQTISGSVIIRENLTVLGSSSITYTTSSQLRVDDNVIVVNTSNPAERFGGLQVYDSGSAGEATGSLFWDSQKNRWVYQNSSRASYGGGVLLSGPRSSGSLGDELTLTSGKIARSAGGDHLNDSIITEYGGVTIGINGSLEITGSIISTVTPLVSQSIQINLPDVTGYSTFSSSIATTDANQNTRLGLLESASSSIRSDFNTYTSSNNTVESTQNGRLTSIESVTGSISLLNTYTGSNNTVIGTLQTTTSSLNTFTSSASGRLTSLETASGSIRSDFNTFTSSNNTVESTQNGRLTSLETYTGSNNTVIGTLQTSTGSLNTFTSSAGGRLTSLESASSSIRSDFNTYTSSNNTVESTQNGRLSSLETASGSIRTDFNTFTSSVNGTNSTQDGRLTSIESKTGSIASLNTYTGSNNTVIGTLQTATSSLNTFSSSINGAIEVTGSNLTIKGNLLVKGTSTQVDSTTVSIGDNIIQLNGTGATNAGLVVRDATAPGTVSGSLLWDTLNDKWIAGTLGSEDDVVLRTASQTLTNKTISGASNTLTNIANASLTNSSITIGSTSTSLGSTSTSLAGLTSVTSTAFTGSLQGNISGNSTNITAYTINQNVGSGSTPQFAGVYMAGNTILSNATSPHTYYLQFGDNSGWIYRFMTSVSGTPTTRFSFKDNGDFTSVGLITGSNFSGTSSGTNTGDETLARINALAITTVGTITGGTWNGTTIAIAKGGTGATDAATARTNLGATTVGGNLFTLTNPGAISFPRFNANNTVSALSAADFRTAIGLGTASTNNTGDFAAYNATHYVGTTAIAANRSSASQTLTGVSIDGNAANITAYTINQSVGSGNSPSFADLTLTGGFTVGGSLSRGTYTTASNYVTGADNIVLKGNASGVSGIFFESEKDGTNINHPSDFAFIQFHSYGIGGSSGEANRLVIGTSNDADDMIVLNPVASDGVKVRVGTGTTDYTVYHSGNVPTWNQNTTGTASNITSYTINQSVGSGNSPTFTGLTVNGNVTLGNTNGHYTRINDTLYVGASDSGDSHFYFGEDSSSWYGSYWYWDSSYNHYWYSRHAGGNTLLMYHDTRETTNVYFQRNILPTSNNAYNLGSATLGWANVYTNDLHLSNMNKPEGNDIDGTSGTWTIQEGAENLYIINNRNNKKFKISLEEIL